MPNDYATLLGQPPRPDKLAFLAWLDELIELRRQACDWLRTGPVRYLKSGGGGSQDGTSDANAFATLAQAQTWLSGLSVGDIAAGPTLLIKRGDTIRLSSGLVIPCDNLKISTYGDPNLPKPIVSFGTILIEQGNSAWINTNSGTDAKNAWYIPWASVDGNPASYSAPGWIWNRDNWQNPFRAVASVAECEDTPRSFFWSSSNSRLYVNPGYLVEAWSAAQVYGSGVYSEAYKIAASDLDYDLTGDTGSNAFPRAIEVPVVGSGGRTGILIENLMTLGWGCSALNWSSAAGITIASGGDCVAYIRDCEDYYTGRHSMSQEVGGTTTGGRALFERCKGGYTNEVKNGGTIFNAYAQAGNECIHLDCEVPFGPLPDSLTSGWTGKPLAWAHAECLPYSAFFAHCNPGSTIGLYASRRCKITDYRSKYPYATTCCFNLGFSINDMPGTTTDPTSWRVYIVDYSTHDSAPSRSGTNLPETAAVAINMPKKGWLINSHVHLWKTWTTGSNMFLGAGQICSLLNTWLTLHDTTTAVGRVLTDNGSTSNLRVQWIGGGVTLVGPTGSSQKVALCGFYSGNVRLANLVVVSRDKPLCLQSTSFASGGEVVATNSATNINAIAAFGAIDSNSGTPTSGGAAGFDQAPGFINLDSLALGRPVASTDRISPDNILYLAGSRRPFLDVPFGAAEYDADSRPRPAKPSIGLFDILDSSHSVGTSAFAGALTFDLVFPNP